MQLVIMVGVPGSGKSTYIDLFKGKRDKVFSSDAYRIGMFGDLREGNKHNEEIFKALHTDMFAEIKYGASDKVFYDATNLNRRKRRAIYTQAKQANKDIKVKIVYIHLPLETVQKQNMAREGLFKVVPENKVTQMYINQQVPRIGVDCDTFDVVGKRLIDTKKRVYFKSLERLMEAVSDDWVEELKNVYTPHDCRPWHLEDVNEHIQMAMDNSTIYHPELREVALFHDLGKGVTKVKGLDGYATYFGHANVSASYLLNYVYFTSSGHPSKHDLELVETVYQHMNAHQGLGAKNIRNNKLTESVIEKCTNFAKIDSMSRTAENLK